MMRQVPPSGVNHIRSPRQMGIDLYTCVNSTWFSQSKMEIDSIAKCMYSKGSTSPTFG